VPPGRARSRWTGPIRHREATAHLSGWSSVDRLGTIACPVRLACGRHDVFTSHPQSFRVADRVKGAQVVIFEDSGHFPWLDEPDRFFAVVEGWLT
jgi:proline iminopeptidase